MNFKLLFILLILFCSSLLHGQEYSGAYLESKSYDYLSLLFDQKIRDTATATQIARAKISKAKREQDFTQIGMGYEQLARVSNKEVALKMLDSTIHYAINSSHADLPAKGYLYKSYIEFFDEQYVSSLRNAILGYNSAKQKENVEQQIAALNSISAVNKLWGNYEKSIETDFLTLDLLKSSPSLDVKYYLVALKNIGLGYVRLKQPDKALHYYKIGIDAALKVKDSVSYYEFVSQTTAPLLLKNRVRSAKDSLFKGDNYRDYFSPGYMHYYNLNLGKYYIRIGDKERGIRFVKKLDEEYTQTKLVQPELSEVYEILIDYYREDTNTKKQIGYLNKLIEVTDLINSKKQKIKSETNEGFIIPKLVEDKEVELDSLKVKNELDKNRMWWAIAALCLIVFVLALIYSRQLVYRKRFDQLVKNKKTVSKTTDVASKKSDISAAIIESILSQLETFESEKKFRDKSITLNKAAKSFGTNSTYLSKVINLEKDKNFSQYLNDLRVEFAMNEINDNPRFRKYTIKAIAEESGFKSGESFSKAFYKIYKIYPSYYLKKLEKTTN